MPSWKGELPHVSETARKPAVNLGREIAVPPGWCRPSAPTSTRLTTQHVHPEGGTCARALHAAVVVPERFRPRPVPGDPRTSPHPRALSRRTRTEPPHAARRARRDRGASTPTRPRSTRAAPCSPTAGWPRRSTPSGGASPTAGIGVGDRVGVRISSGTAELYVAILAVLAAGAAYVPVDADDPEERAELVFGEAGVCAVLGDNGSMTRAQRADRHAGLCPATATTRGSSSRPARRAPRRASRSATAPPRRSSTPRPACSSPRSRSGPATACWRGCRSPSTPPARRCGSRGGTAPAWCPRRGRWCAPASTWGRGWRRSGSRSSPPSRRSPRCGRRTRWRTCGC